MSIVEYNLTIESQVGDKNVIQSLIYRGNENIIIESSQYSDVDDVGISIRLSRHVIETFMELIK